MTRFWMSLLFTAALVAEPGKPFVTGVNYPWIAYGHDFGSNPWGHDGLITGGWTHQTYFDSQGITDSRFSTEKARSGTGALRLSVDLAGGHAQRDKGEVYVDLATHAPPGLSVPVDLTGATVSCWLFLPRGMTGVQFFFKSEGFRSLYTAFHNVRSDQVERWVRFTADASRADHVDAGYDPTRVIIVGVKLVGSVAGTAFLDDFAAGPIAFDFETLEVERDFAALQRNCAVSAVRIFVFTDGRAAPEFAPDGRVTGLDALFFDDFDALLAAAGKHGLQVIPVLLDFTWFDRARLESGVQLGGRADVFRDPDLRQSFLDNALKPLVNRYCGDPRILAWDVINEPEWATKELPTGFQTTDPIALAEMQELVRLAAETIHECPGQKVTVGSARRMWLRHWRGLGLDLYQFHWYEHFAPEEPFPWPPASELQLDEPVIAGEVPTANSRYSARDYLQAAIRGGYDGLLLWSHRARDHASGPVPERWCTSLRRRVARSSQD